MRLHKQLIEKDISNFNQFMINKKYLRALTFFYGAYNISCAILDYHDPLTNRKNTIWKKYFASAGRDKKLRKKLLKFTKTDMKIISDAMNLILSENDKMGDYGISVMPRGKGYVGIAGLDFDNL